MDYQALAQQCAPAVAPRTILAVVRVESGMNPYAIGVVGGRLARQPRSMGEAVATARALERDGWNFSVGAAQVNRYNLAKYGLDYIGAFDPCASLRAGSAILKDCHDRAARLGRGDALAWRMAFSCYYSGNFRAGFRPDVKGQPSYVGKVLASAANPALATPVAGPRVPAMAARALRTAAPAPGQGAAGAGWDAFGAREI